jgi:uncharacterized protein (TIGR00251 family)
LTLRVSPGAARAGIVGRHGAGWKVRVTAAPEDGKANAALIELLARALDVPRRAVTIAAGAASRKKLVDVAGDPAELRPRILALLRADWKRRGRD